MPPGLRERKKEQTRQLIADTAWRLFADRGFDQVTVAEVARQADVATATVFNVIAASSALQAREHQALARTAAALAALLASETGAPHGDLVARVTANALVGVQRALVDHTRARVLANQDLGQLATDVRRAAQHAFAALEHGLGDYAPKPGPARPQ